MFPIIPIFMLFPLIILGIMAFVIVRVVSAVTRRHGEKYKPDVDISRMKAELNSTKKELESLRELVADLTIEMHERFLREDREQ